jgi:hypothetical protein
MKIFCTGRGRQRNLNPSSLPPQARQLASNLDGSHEDADRLRAECREASERLARLRAENEETLQRQRSESAAALERLREESAAALEQHRAQAAEMSQRQSAECAAASQRHRSEVAVASEQHKSEAAAASERHRAESAAASERHRTEVAEASQQYTASLSQISQLTHARRRSSQRLVEQFNATALLHSLLAWARACAEMERAAVVGREAAARRAATIGALFVTRAATAEGRCALRFWAERARALGCAAATGSDGWRRVATSLCSMRRRAFLRRQTLTRLAVCRRSLMHVRRHQTTLDRAGMQRVVFSVWRMWVDGVRLYAECSMLNAHRAGIHTTQGPWWATL